MDFKFWDKAVVAWVNSLISATPEENFNEINDSALKDIIKKINPDCQDDLNEFLKNVYPNLLHCDSHEFSTSIDSLCSATLLLIYISFSNKIELGELREKMCTQLDNSTQQLIAEFLMSMQKYENVFSISLKTVKQEIHSFVKSQNSQISSMGDCMMTPVKNNLSNSSFESPLQGFFQTPKRSQQRHKGSSNMCLDGDHLKLLKKLKNQLVEEESEKVSLQEQLNNYIQKCNENETKLRNKIEEINLLKCEWELESNKNEAEYKVLKNNIMRKLEDEKKLKNEVSHLEKYVSNLETELSNSRGEKDKLEYQLKTTLGKCLANEAQLKEMTELNIQLKEAIDIKEKELAYFKEEYAKFYKDEKSIDLSFMDGSFDRSMSVPENMGVVIDKLLEEKVEENNLLKVTVEELKNEKNSLLNEIKTINEQLLLKLSTIKELQFLNKELNAKLVNLDLAEQELSKTQKELINSNTEIRRLMKENCDLNKKCNALSKDLQEREQALVNSKTSRVLLQVNFLKLAEDFKAVLQRLEFEVENISKLAGGNFTKLEKSLESPRRTENSRQEGQITLPVRTSVPADKWSKIEEFLEHFESEYFEWSDSKISLENTCAQLNENIVVLRMKITGLKDAQLKSVEEKTRLENLLKMSDEKITAIRAFYSCEVKNVKEEADEKEKKVKELENAIDELKKIKESLAMENENLRKEAVKLGEENRLLQLAGEAQKHDSIMLDKRSEQIREQQEFNDSLEEVPLCNKTFDIVNLEERSIINKTFSIKKDFDAEESGGGAAWVVSPPSKVPARASLVRAQGKRHVQGESWVVPIPAARSKRVSSSVNDLKSESGRAERGSSLIKASSLSSVLEIDYSPPSVAGSKSSTTSVFSCTDVSTLSKKDEPNRTPRKVKTGGFTIARGYEEVQAEGSPRKLNKKSENTGALNNEIALNKLFVYEETISNLQNKVVNLSKERDSLKSIVLELEQKRKRDKETFEKNQDVIRQNIASKYEAQLEHLKNEMKLLHNSELAKHKSEQSKLVVDLREQNKRYKEHIDELRNQLWDLGEKLLQEQKSKRDLERNYKELRIKFERKDIYRDSDTKSVHGAELYHVKDSVTDENNRMSAFRQIPNSTYPIIPTEDEDEVFDNRFLEDMKTGSCKVERPEGRLLELQYRNSLCLPHLKSSYPGETQFHNPVLFKENDIKQGSLAFGQESQSLTDSDQSMTRSLLPENKGKKKEQTSYKKPGPPTPSKNGGRLSIQSGDVRLTPRNALKELSEQNEKNRGTPNPLKGLLLSKKSLGGKDENTAPVTPRKRGKFFRKPFGAKDH